MAGETTIGTYLGWADVPSTGVLPTSFDVVSPIYNYSELFGQPEEIDNTTMSDKVMTNLAGLSSQPMLTCSAPYDAKVMHALKEARGKKKVACLLMEGNGGNGTSSLLYWQGTFDRGMDGGEVNSRREMTIYVSCLTEKDIDGNSTGTSWTPAQWEYDETTNKIKKKGS